MKNYPAYILSMESELAELRLKAIEQESICKSAYSAMMSDANDSWYSWGDIYYEESMVHELYHKIRVLEDKIQYKKTLLQLRVQASQPSTVKLGDIARITYVKSL